MIKFNPSFNCKVFIIIAMICKYLQTLLFYRGSQNDGRNSKKEQIKILFLVFAEEKINRVMNNANKSSPQLKQDDIFIPPNPISTKQKTSKVCTLNLSSNGCLTLQQQLTFKEIQEKYKVSHKRGGEEDVSNEVIKLFSSAPLKAINHELQFKTKLEYYGSLQNEQNVFRDENIPLFIKNQVFLDNVIGFELDSNFLVPAQNKPTKEEDQVMFPIQKKRKRKTYQLYPKNFIFHGRSDPNSYIDINSSEYIYNEQDYFDDNCVFEIVSSHKRSKRETKKETTKVTSFSKQSGFTATTEFRAIWKSVCIDALKTQRQQSAIKNNLILNAKKYIYLCQKEAKNKAGKYVRLGKDFPLRAKKLFKESQLYWRKYQKVQKGAKLKAHKEALEQRKRDEEIREAKRQQRKLNFLLTQTELYAHFIGKKGGADLLKEAEVEKIEDLLEDEDVSDKEEHQEMIIQASKMAQSAIKSQTDRTKIFDDDMTNRKSHSMSLQGSQMEPPKIEEVRNKPPQEDMSKDVGLANTGLDELTISQPNMFYGSLKGYQLKGLNWLVNLYDQGINGILADEMGLGKTIQSIAFLAHLAESKDIWGPFLIIAPVSTLHNWQSEVNKFTPNFKTLPYWGTQAERKVIRKYWNPKHLYTRSASLHVLVTSYQLIVQDEKYFRRVKWQYMILDEAHALKSSSSLRWKILLSFNCRNRLLLSGTPIQNNMAELWALLHFIMPTFFDSHDEFNDWFSKDIENHAERAAALNEQQISRLHKILKPFMLRRIKKEVEHEMVQKTELELKCQLTERQSRLYRSIRAKFTYSDLANTNLDSTVQHLMNLVMQFRKVCNHPELFDRRGVVSPFLFRENQESPNTNNPISVPIPKIFYREGLFLGNAFNPPPLTTSPQYNSIIRKFFCIFNTNHIYDSLYGSSSKESNISRVHHNNCFSFLPFCNLSVNEFNCLITMDIFQCWIAEQVRREYYDLTLHAQTYGEDYQIVNRSRFLIRQTSSPTSLSSIKDSEILSGLTASNPFESLKRGDKPLLRVIKSCYFYSPPVLCSPFTIKCSDRSAANAMNYMLNNREVDKYFFGENYLTERSDIKRISTPSPFVLDTKYTPVGGMMVDIYDTLDFSFISLPTFGQLLRDSGKLQLLDKLLKELKDSPEGHRVLIYCQMTKMINILEEFMNFRKYKYHRLDGASKLSQRRDMVDDFQANADVFAFLLSTRAGGLGINLTAADTVIFYDSDWNPTMDAQAMDRAHRLGQTRPVTVYRLVTEGTVEEKILKRAKEKHTVCFLYCLFYILILIMN